MYVGGFGGNFRIERIVYVIRLADIKLLFNLSSSYLSVVFIQVLKIIYEKQDICSAIITSG